MIDRFDSNVLVDSMTRRESLLRLALRAFLSVDIGARCTQIIRQLDLSRSLVEKVYVKFA